MKAEKAKEIAEHSNISHIFKEIKKSAKNGNFSCLIKGLKVEEAEQLKSLGYYATPRHSHLKSYTFYEISWE